MRAYRNYFCGYIRAEQPVLGVGLQQTRNRGYGSGLSRVGVAVYQISADCANWSNCWSCIDAREQVIRIGNSGLLVYRMRTYYNICEVVILMDTKDIIRKLRTEKGLSQDELAEKLYIKRQAVSRWENGETIPNTETLKLLSKFFDVSINTLLGSPRRLICQCCGMPLDDSSISKEPDGTFNEEYCKWCYTGGEFIYKSIEELTEFLVDHMSNENWPPEQARAFFEAQLPKLNYWNKS